MLLNDLEVILRVAEFRSITAAANSLDMRTATASAAVKRVEAEIGAQLFVRTTRQLRLSTAGERYIPECQRAVQMLKQAKRHMQNELDIVDGELRLAMSSDLGRNTLLPLLDQLMDQYPSISVRTRISDSNVDLYRDQVDVAVRYGSPTDANVYGFKICAVPRVLCASPAYLESQGVPQHPQQLAEHNALLYQLQDLSFDHWQFEHQRQTHRVKVTSNRSSNDGDLVRRWCLAGKGIALKSCLDVADDLLAGRLQPLLLDYRAAATELWLLTPSRQGLTPAVRLLRDRLQQHCQQQLEQLTRHQLIR